MISNKVAIALIIMVIISLTPLTSSAQTSIVKPSNTEQAQVIRVIDGDTIEVDIDGVSYTVRYIGMDTPELQNTEWFGVEASTKNQELVGGQTIDLEKDVSETDQYGRLLRYVWVGDTMVNYELVYQGYARVATYPPDVRYELLFSEAEQEARENNRGLWSQNITPPAGYTCDKCIKGNINSKGEKIYHFPGCPNYDSCKIDESDGERWFSSESEALAAGWGKAKNCP